MSCSTSTTSPATTPPIIKGSALNALISDSTDPKAPEYACIWELMDAVDTWIKTPDRAADKPFLMPIEDVFTISGRGTVVTGRVERGTVKVGDKVEIVGIKDTRRPPSPAPRCSTRPSSSPRLATTSAACSAASTRRASSVARFSLLEVHPPHTKFKGQVYVLSKEEGGRHTRSSTTTVPSSTSVPPT